LENPAQAGKQTGSVRAGRSDFQVLFDIEAVKNPSTEDLKIVYQIAADGFDLHL